ncbi:MAG: ABC-F type ribosomal protection protein [Hespellia sp.]|nr:ABC-F type ribosomal protection protein [Hespellia sp.]
MILACQNITKSFGEEKIITSGSFHIEEHEKAALVGPNGTGKTTILKMIVGELSMDSGEVILSKGATLGYLAQYQKLQSDGTIYEEVRSAKAHIFAMEERLREIERELKHLEGEELQSRLELYHRLSSQFELENGYACESEIVGVLKGLGFDEVEFDKHVDTLSGGEKTRVALGKLLLTKPDVILLDEPTNHLDLNSVRWLETYLLNYPGAVLIVSHDRYFLNRIVTKIIDLDFGRLRMYSGNYKEYAAKKQQLLDARIKEYLNQQQMIRHQEAVIEKLKSFNREKSIKRAESREKMLNKIERIEKPEEALEGMHFTLETSVQSGRDVLTVERLSKGYGSRILFQDISFEIKRGEHVAIIGDNGTGKTTLLKILNRVEDADQGLFQLGVNVEIGYYDQEHQVLHKEKTIFEEISDAYPDMGNTRIRNTLAAFQFTGDDVYKMIGDLSGGERGRVSLAKLMLSKSNFLILDEPTNHLDIQSKEILEQALNRYQGTILYVSHDRYFINQTASRILELTNQNFVNYIGNYDYYLEKKEELNAVYAKAEKDSSECLEKRNVGLEKETTARLSWQEQKELQAQERKRKNDLKKTEDRISFLENRDMEIDDQMQQEEVYTNSVKCQELAREKAEIAEELERLYEMWEGLAQ